MSPAKFFFNSNLRFLRERRRLSQEDLAQQLDITRNKLQALESGKTKNPLAEDLVKISEFFKVSIDSLVKVDLTRLGEQKLRELLAGNDVYMTGSNIRVLAITVDEKNRENIEYVPVKAKAGYAAGYNDPDYLASLPRFTFPNLPKRGTFRVFRTTGDSMLPVPEDSDIIAEYVQDWYSLKAATPCVVILKGEQDFVFKLVTVQRSGKLSLASFNPIYAPFEVEAADVLEIWKYYRHQTGTLPETETDLQEIKRMIVSIEKQLITK